MLITIQSKDTSCVSALPNEVRGAHWLVDARDNRIIFVEARDGSWRFTLAPGLRLSGDELAPEDGFSVEPGQLAIINLTDGEGEWSVVCRPSSGGDKNCRIIGFAQDAEITLGRTEDNAIVYPSRFVSSRHACLALKAGRFTMTDHGSVNGVYLNGGRIPANNGIELFAGDVVTILGLHISIGDRFISLNNPEGRVTVNDIPGAVQYRAGIVDVKESPNVKEKRYFYPALRFARSIERKSFVVDAPPQREQEDDTPIAMRIGPSLVMALASVMSAAISVSYFMQQGSGTLRAIPMVAMAVAMLCGSVLWPILNKRYQAKKYVRKEAQRRGAYSQYLGKVRSELLQETQLQSEILHENRMASLDCMVHAHEADAWFMSRTPLHKDYLELRIGIGDEPLDADIRFPDYRFDVMEDDLRDVVDKFSKEPHILTQVPLGYSLIGKSVLGVVGESAATTGFLRNLIVQIAALHSYSDVKIVLLCDETQRNLWRFVSYLPHCFNDEGTMRYFSCSIEEANEVGMALDRVFELRRDANSFDARDADPYYVLFCPSKAIYDKSETVKKILEARDNRGFSLIATASEMHELPRQCRSIIGIEGANGYLLDRDDPLGNRQPFVLDASVNIVDAEVFAFDVAKGELDLANAKESLPDRLGFLEMFGVAKVEHLNVAARWRDNNASATLSTSVGLDALGEPFLLNLHEDFHGPHGLIAGTTGSGKSEFIITYILSLAINYSPEDVAFVLIDYKGGGLANAFDNDRLHLPHLAGTITNLDGAAITRSLVSVKSELQRRQRLFNTAREVIGGDNVDIYKYLNLFKQGRVSEPCPHLFIIADEFAELKQQEPEFMDELISAARIGRSLGVHLILATQKPTGVVNDQIWSNARFKVCLKVADGADSQEMIRRPDAAEITQAGRFYLMVGYNEQFSMGQSGYSGVPYMPSAQFERKKDESVEYISNTGRTLLSVKPRVTQDVKNAKSEVVALLEHVEQVAQEQGKMARQLWLNPLPAHIQLESLERKYKYAPGDGFVLNPVLGEYDDPANQQQHLLTLPLSTEGNAVIYGTSDGGVESLIQTMLYSLIKHHSARTMNAYILDFGSQALSCFASAPQVGDVILLNDEEKVRRFFDYMSTVIARRRKLFAQYGGSFTRYCENSEGCPAIVIVLNGVSAFLETYPKYEDAYLRLARESSQAGIWIVMTAEGSSAVRMRLRNSFRQLLTCELADPGDYVMLFGSMRGLPQPSGFARGLVRVNEGIFEFQTAAICAEDVEGYEYIASQCAEIVRDGMSDAPCIPVAPEHVLPQMLCDADVTDAFIPYGVHDDDLSLAGFDFSDSPIARCQFQKRKDGAAFLEAFIAATSLRAGWDVVLLDTAQLLSERPQGCLFATRSDEHAANYLRSIMREGSWALKSNRLLVVICGVMDFINRSGVDFSGEIKMFLRELDASREISFAFFDASSDTGYTYEDWFKSHMTNAEGLWVGAGIDAQNSIAITYSARFVPNNTLKASGGYDVDNGAPRFLHLVEMLEDKEAGND